MKRSWRIVICAVYASLCFWLSVKAACFGVCPDGASFTCGHAEYLVLHVLLIPSSLLYYVPMARNMVAMLDDVVRHPDVVLSCVLTISNSMILYGILYLFRQEEPGDAEEIQKAAPKENGDDVV